ncbi:GntR family transcriptional regulator [Clostridium sp.]|uniref:GntR family transcriptional regulator n=1 Tax=Clostridium sp. TaxID=1506 RepID=UPI003993EB29
MLLSISDDIPIYFQIANAIKDAILSETFKDEEQIPSTNEISLNYKINPATVRKGFNILVEEGIIYKKRGMGMFVVKGAREILMERRRDEFYKEYILKLMEEAKKLNISGNEIIAMISKYDNKQ